MKEIMNWLRQTYCAITTNHTGNLNEEGTHFNCDLCGKRDIKL